MSKISLANLADKMKRIGSLFENRVQKEIKDSAIKAHENLILETPVDTGLASSNWILSVDSTDKSIRPAVGESILSALSDAQGAIKRYKLGKYIYIQNNVDYVGILNTGWSSQQPTPGWIQDVIRDSFTGIGTRIKLVFK